MDKNPLMDAFCKEFLRQVELAGFHHLAGEFGGEDICYQIHTVATLTAEDELAATNELGTNRMFDQLHQLHNTVLEPYYRFRVSPSVCGTPNTRILCEYNDVALIARARLDGTMEYSTGQCCFDYTEIQATSIPGTNFSVAKDQFSIRANLTAKERLITASEIEELAHACAFYIAQYPGLNADRKEVLTQLKDRLLDKITRKNAQKLAQRATDSPEIAIRQAGVPMGLFEKRIEPGYLLEDGAALLESDRDIEGNYLGGAGMDGMYLKTGAVYAPVLDEAGHIRAFRKLAPLREKTRMPLSEKPVIGKRIQSTPER